MGSFREELDQYSLTSHYQFLFPDRSTYNECLNILLATEQAELERFDPKMVAQVKRNYGVIKENGQQVLVFDRTKKRILCQDRIEAEMKRLHDDRNHPGRDGTKANFMKIYQTVPKSMILAYLRHCSVCGSRQVGKSEAEDEESKETDEHETVHIKQEVIDEAEYDDVDGGRIPVETQLYEEEPPTQAPSRRTSGRRTRNPTRALTPESPPSPHIPKKRGRKKRIHQEQERATSLHEELKLCKGKLEAFSYEILLLHSQMDIVTRFLNKEFGINLINKDSNYFHNRVFDLEEIDDLAKGITLPEDDEDADALSSGSEVRYFDDNDGFGETLSDNDFGLFPESESNLTNDPEVKVKPSRRPQISYASLEEPDDEPTAPRRGRKRGPYGPRGTGSKRKSKSEYPCAGPQICDECGKVIKSMSSLRLHKLIHTGEKPHICVECGVGFRTGKHLRAHTMRKHTKERKLVCSHCPKKFFDKKDIVIHERTHTGEKPFACTFEGCTKAFNIKEHLKMHSRVHSGERPYECLTCGKAFSQANSLRIHKKLHEPSNDPNNPGSKRKARKPKGTGGSAILVQVQVQEGNGSVQDQGIIEPILVQVQDPKDGQTQPALEYTHSQSSDQSWNSSQQHDGLDLVSATTTSGGGGSSIPTLHDLQLFNIPQV